MSKIGADHVHKKVGLAKMAKAHSLTNGLNNLGLEVAQEVKPVDVLVAPGSSIHPSVLLTCPNPSPSIPVGFSTKEVTGTAPSSEKYSPNLHKKLVSSTSAGAQTLHNVCNAPELDTTQDSSPEVDSSSSTKEKKRKESAVGSPFKASFLQSLNRKSFRKKKSQVNDPYDTYGECSLSSSPVQDHLRVPKPVRRSRSLSRLSDAFSQVNSVCLLSTTTKTKCDEGKAVQLPTASSTNTLMVASHPPALSSSPNSSPSLRIRTLKMRTEHAPSSHNNNKARCRPSRSPLKSKNRVAPLNAGSQLAEKSVEVPNGIPGRTRSESRVVSGFVGNGTLRRVSCSDSNFEKYSNHTSKINAKTRKTKNRARRAKMNNRKDLRDSSSSNSPSVIPVDQGNKTIHSCSTSPATLSSSMSLSVKHNPEKARMPLHLDSTATNRSGRPASWCNFENMEQYFVDGELSDDESDLESVGDGVSDDSSRRWSSCSQLSGQVAPLGQLKLAEAKQKTYLFGGMGSLLGPTELERYFPDRNVVVFIATWNMNGKEPPDSLDDFLLPDDVEHMPDMYVIGTQESGGDKTEWEVRLQTTIGPSHVLFHSAVLGILHITIFLRRDLVWFCSVPEDANYSLRPGTYFKTKGAIGISFQFFGTRMVFINTHLFAHEEKLLQRIQNYKNIIANLDLPRNLRRDSMHRSKDITKRYDIVFWLGDLNFRLVGPRDEILETIKTCSKSGDGISDLLDFDQLTQARDKGEIFEDFSEGKITFAPTFKFDVGTNHYDTSSKQRVPSYTDRILYKSKRDPIKCTNYGSLPLFKTSDHKPVWGLFHFKVRPGKDDVPLAAGLFQREIYLTALKRRRRYFHQPSSRNCQMQ